MRGNEVNGAARVPCPKGRGPQFTLVDTPDQSLGGLLFKPGLSFGWEPVLGDTGLQPSARVASSLCAEQAEGLRASAYSAS